MYQSANFVSFPLILRFFSTGMQTGKYVPFRNETGGPKFFLQDSQYKPYDVSGNLLLNPAIIFYS